MTSTDARQITSHLLGLRARVQWQRFILAFKYDPDQPRDERGRWAETGDAADEDEGPSVLPIARRRDKRREAECDEQFKRDIFQCNMVGLASRYAQAHFRYSACLNGDPIPPFNY